MNKGLIYPPRLKKDDKVLITSPSGKIDKHLIKGLKTRLIKWGLDPILGKNAISKSGSYAGTIKQRLNDLQFGLDNDNIKAIFCSRGGYGSIHLIEHLNLSKFEENPKWLIGYSDITVLHSFLFRKGFASIHAPMARHFTVEPEDDASLTFLQKQLEGNPTHYTIKTHPYNHKGKASGILIGGNFSVLQGLRSTPLDIQAKGSILYIEDINENPYAIERMLYNLKLSGVLEDLSGLIIGQFTVSPEDKDISQKVYEYIRDLLKPYKYPICYNFPIGHLTNNYPIINGAFAELEVNRGSVELKFG